MNVSLSKAVSHLDSVSRARYIDKLSAAGVTDPYDLPSHLFTPLERNTSFDEKALPDLGFPDIFNYLVETCSFYTSANMKAYKSLESYTYFVAGWVYGMQTWSVLGKQRVLVMSKVCHSQRLGEPPLRPWVSIQLDGQVVCAHCTCMAGIGEACSHIGATLFALETSITLLRNTACTSKPCEWIRPNAQQLEYAQGADIEFISPRRKLKEALCESSGAKRACSRPVPVSPLTAKETSDLYAAIAACGTKCSILSIVPPYCEAYVPRAITSKLPPPLPDLHLDNTYVRSNDFSALTAKCADTFAAISITSEEAAAIECETRGQSSTMAWFRYRAGRITSSNFKAAVRTQIANSDNLSRSLIKRICYPNSYKFTSAATTWGSDNESAAVTAYEAVAKDGHSDLFISSSPGLYINPRYAHLGASPDAMVECSCHGKGIVEVKCPYTKRTATITEAADVPALCLLKGDDGVLHLKADHEYYYQVQTQLFVTELPYCDFVVYTGCGKAHVERVVPDAAFWATNIDAATKFYISGVLPELIGKWYTRMVAHVGTDVGADLFCYCQKADTDGDMLLCCEAACKVKRFHRVCLGLKRVPKHTWRCPDCRKLVAKKHK